MGPALDGPQGRPAPPGTGLSGAQAEYLMAISLTTTQATPLPRCGCFRKCWRRWGSFSEKRVAGINRCRSSKIPQPEYAEADAWAVAKTLGRPGFPKRNVRVLEEELNPKMGENDRLFLSFSGHGAIVR